MYLFFATFVGCSVALLAPTSPSNAGIPTPSTDGPVTNPPRTLFTVLVKTSTVSSIPVIGPQHNEQKTIRTTTVPTYPASELDNRSPNGNLLDEAVQLYNAFVHPSKSTAAAPTTVPPPAPTFKPMPHDQAAPDAGEGAPDEEAPAPATTNPVPTNQAANHPGWKVCWEIPSNGLTTPSKQLYPPDFKPPAGWQCQA